MEKKVLHSERALICMGIHGFVLSFVRGLEQNLAFTPDPSLFITIGGKTKTKQNKVKGHKTSVSETQNWETNGYTWILPFVFASTGDPIGYCGKE